MTNVDACSNLGDGFVTPSDPQVQTTAAGNPDHRVQRHFRTNTNKRLLFSYSCFPSQFRVAMVRLSLAKVFPSPLCRRVLSKMVMGAFVLRLEP